MHRWLGADMTSGEWKQVAQGTTDSDGTPTQRCPNPPPPADSYVHVTSLVVAAQDGWRTSAAASQRVSTACDSVCASRRSRTVTHPAKLPTRTRRPPAATGPYYAAKQQRTFYPYVDVVVEIADPAQHYHVPLLLNPFGYSTYRGT